MKLKVNREKTECAYIGRLKFLGYGFYVRSGKCRLRLHEKSEAKLRRKLKQITSRSNGMGYAQRKTAQRNDTGLQSFSFLETTKPYIVTTARPCC